MLVRHTTAAWIHIHLAKGPRLRWPQGGPNPTGVQAEQVVGILGARRRMLGKRLETGDFPMKFVGKLGIYPMKHAGNLGFFHPETWGKIGALLMKSGVNGHFIQRGDLDVIYLKAKLTWDWLIRYGIARVDGGYKPTYNFGGPPCIMFYTQKIWIYHVCFMGINGHSWDINKIDQPYWLWYIVNWVCLKIGDAHPKWPFNGKYDD